MNNLSKSLRRDLVLRRKQPPLNASINCTLLVICCTRSVINVC
jgi:hypothetical protein